MLGQIFWIVIPIIYFTPQTTESSSESLLEFSEGAGAPDDVEVSPAMIEAGRSCCCVEGRPFDESETVKMIYRAIHAIRQQTFQK